MKTKSFVMFSIILILASPILLSQEETPDLDKTSSPYFYIHSDDPDTERLPLKSTSALVKIAGVIADVTITQEYKNEGKTPIEAVYVFPASTRAAVYSMVMTIGERVIVARIEEKDRARQQYEEAKANGQSASLLEQERPNVFTMNVANIMPGDLIKVELKYTELLIPENRVYRFIYPTVVGPRYSGSQDEMALRGEGWNANPYTLEGFKPLYGFNVEIGLNSGMPIQSLRCPSHKTNIQYTNQKEANITLDETEVSGGNRDFILEYRLAGDMIESGVLLFPGEKENFFLAMLQPPDRISPGLIPPREYVFIVDVSGSMHGFPLETSKKLLRDLIDGLKPADRFNVILFAGASSLFAEKSVEASEDNIRSAINFIEKEQGGGGTELLPALKRALNLKGTEGFSRTFIIATDGYVTVEREAFELVRGSLGRANFFAFGIGSGVNHYLIEGLAHAGQGEPFVVTDENGAKAAAKSFRKYISSPVMTGIDIKFDGFEVYDLAQQSWPDVFADRPVLIFGKYRGKPAGSILIRGESGNDLVEQRINIAMVNAKSENRALKYLWAREKIRLMDDYANIGYETDGTREEVTSLGLKYNLLTRYTSFIAIDSEVRNPEGNSTTIRQPLPLPQGVSNYAVGGVMSRSAPGAGKRGNMAIEASYKNLDEGYFVEEEIQTIEETSPVFKGGEKALDGFIKSNLKYPAESRKNGISGKVIVEFLVDTDGSIKDIHILYSLDEHTDQEVIRVVRLMSGMWEPGIRNGKKVAMRVALSSFEF
jgi:Ca-activated chloride channel family protein